MMLSNRVNLSIEATKPANDDCTVSSIFPFLSDDSNPAFRNILDAGDLVTLPTDVNILQPESLCKHFIMLLSGTVRVYQQTSDDREITLYRINAGDLCVLSINGLLNKNVFGAFATTETQVQALMLSSDQFDQAMAVSEVFRRYVLNNLSGHFRDVLELAQVTVFESLDVRLICLLGRMSRATHCDVIRITHKELARELGTSREVISRLLKGLERRSCIKLGRGTIQIMD